MQRLPCLFFLLLLLLPQAASAGQPDPWAPRQQCLFGMPYLGQIVKPQQTGLINQMFRLLFEEEDVLFRHVRMPYGKAVEGVVNGTINMTLDMEPSRKGVVTARSPLVTYDMAAAYKFETGFKGVQSLAGKRVAYLNGIDVYRFLPVEIQAHPVYDLGSGFHQLDGDLVDYLLGDIALLRDAMLEAQLPSGKIVITYMNKFLVRPIFTDSKEGRMLRDIYDRRMEEIIENGDLVELLRGEGMTEKRITEILEANR